MPKRIFTEEEKQQIIYYYTVEKMGSKPLGKKFHCSAPTILKNLAEWGIAPNSKKLDLTNRTFGKLRVIKPAEPRNDKYTRWVCECECGNIVEVRTDYLTSSHTTSCGCEKNKYFSKLIKLNKVYGKLTPLYYDENKQQYFCKCECGNTIFVKGYNLSNGNTQSCGCLKSKGELKINQLLTKLNIDFKTQYYFEDCRFLDTNRYAYFDYAIFKNNHLIGLIEYDGEQHFIGWGNNQESLNEIRKKDMFKNEYCLKNNIILKRISYKEYDSINEDYLLNIILNMEKEAQEVKNE